jgi:glucokinase
MGQYILAYDVGGSHATAALADSATLQLTAIHSCSLDSSGPAAAVLDALAAVGRQAIAAKHEANMLGIGMAMPGPFDYEQGICYIRGLTKYDQLYGVNFRQEVAARFRGITPEAVRFVNDARASLLGEIHRGAAVGARRVIGLTLGTGIGSAFAVDGRIIESGAGVPPGGYIYCLPWREGTIEDVVSSRGLQRRYRQATGETLDIREIATRATHDPVAQQVMQDFGRALGEILQPLVEGFAPDVVVLGGGIAKSAALFVPATRSVLAPTKARLAVSSLFELAAIVGAAVAWRGI